MRSIRNKLWNKDNYSCQIDIMYVEYVKLKILSKASLSLWLFDIPYLLALGLHDHV